MKKSLMDCFALTAIIPTSGIAAAGDDFGIQSYPGAKSDADTKEVCAAPSMGIIKEREDSSGLTKSKHCYRTNDSFAKVVEFYKKQKGLTGGVVVDEEGAKSASFCLSKTDATQSFKEYIHAQAEALAKANLHRNLSLA